MKVKKVNQKTGTITVKSDIWKKKNKDQRKTFEENSKDSKTQCFFDTVFFFRVITEQLESKFGNMLRGRRVLRRHVCENFVAASDSEFRKRLKFFRLRQVKDSLNI